MILNDIKQPFKGEIEEIIKNSSTPDACINELKLYVLSESYFKTIHTEPTWVAYEIFRKIGSDTWKT